MGLGNSTRATYVQIVDGKIARRFQAPIQGVTVQRQTSTGKIVHEQLFDHLSGFITDISIVPPKEQFKDFGDSLVVKLVDGEENFVLQMQKDGGYAAAFFKVLPNIDFTKRTTIIPSMKMEGEKKKVTVFVTQQGISGALKHAFTRDNPNGMPALKEVMYKGKMVWDNTDLMKFFTDLLNNEVKPKLSKAVNNLPNQPQNVPADARPPKDEINSGQWEGENDLPF